MMNKKIVPILIGVMILTLVSNSYAWDGRRQGFLLGFGVGLGFTSFTQKVSVNEWGYRYSFERDRDTKGAIMTDFKIGYAPNDFMEIYYTSKVSWFGLKNVYGENVTIANGLGAVGVSYFFWPEAPSPFVGGGIGYSTWATPFEENTDTWTGFGIFIGGGYEFTPHWNIEGYLSFGKPNDEEYGIEVSSNAMSIMVTINVLGY